MLLLIFSYVEKDQLNEIRKTTLALIVCMTTDIHSVQQDAFDVPSHV